MYQATPESIAAKPASSLPRLSALLQNNVQSIPLKPSRLKGPREWSSEEKLAFLRQQKLGRYSLVPSPCFWRALCPEADKSTSLRAMLHLDYTASAQGLALVEQYIQECSHTYANTHTETSTTGRMSTQRFHEAIEVIRRHVKAGEESFVIASGYGATGAIEKIQKILGLYLSPKGQNTIRDLLGIDLKQEMAKKVVVFVGPYEHHSNDVTWQDDALCTFVRIKAQRSGPHQTAIDLDDLAAQLDRYQGYMKIGSFSAASNVTGMKCNLKALGDLLHKKQALFFVDYAACGPYADIDMQRDGIDAIYLSIHKNLGGSNLGFLIGRQHIYDKTSNPSFGGGGTVSAVTPWEYHFHASIEEREAAGTPAIRQTWQAALSFQIKEWVGYDLIHERELALSRELVSFLSRHPKLQMLGNPDPDLRYPIFSFLVKHGDRMLHHNLVASLLNDLFGIQARSGCACAGPFGHELLGIERELSTQYVQLILNILNGFKPGWTRIGAHYTLSQEELDYTKKAISAIAWFGPLFLEHYRCDPYSGNWQHIDAPAADTRGISWTSALELGDEASLHPQVEDEKSLSQTFRNQLEEFYALAALQAAQYILKEVQQKGSTTATVDVLASLLHPLMKQHVEAFYREEQSFLHDITQVLCPVLAPPGKDWRECQRDVENLLRAVLFAPQHHMHRYEDFSIIEKRLHFFYVAKGNLTQEIRLQEPPAQGTCSPCIQR